MRKLLVLILFGGLLALGCSQPSKPGTKKGTEAPKKTEPAKTEPAKGDMGEITLELVAVEVEEGKDAAVEIKIKGKGYKEEVVIVFDAKDAEGVKVDPAEVKVKPGDESAKVKVSLDKEKKGGKVKVTATGKDVKEFKGDFDVKKK